MTRYIVIGTYTNSGAAGILDGDSDREQAMDALCKSVGAKLVSAHITRGQYDFCVIVDATSFAMVAAMTLKARTSGAIDQVVTLEALDYNEIRKVGSAAHYTPPTG